ncbi:MAG TPA: dipeptide ABC transporter ATP-binding protein [Candidatus Avanaerovorax faecigallinarum]|nr:dipeptide ABC transporter ATP-binding protein [Candidatus Avanaerovorax faecigallinarum]
MENKKVLVETRNLTKEFKTKSGAWGKNKATVHAVTDVNLHVYEGETLGVVGESGCGKSTLGRLMLRLLDATRGEVFFDGTELNTLKEEELRHMRKQMQMVFQDPFASLNPRLKIKDIIAEPMITHNMYSGKGEMEDRIADLLKKTGIRPEFMNRYPHQFSGGQRQRVSIARALALNPRLVICDEPVSALDVSIQSQILNLLGDLQAEMNLTYVFISHDLSVVRYLSDRVCVMFLGKVCELGITRDIYARPLHPYTQFLLEAVPIPDPERRKEAKNMLSGEIPSPVNPPSGCYFRTRCPYATEKCAQEAPALREVEPDRFVACHLMDK